MRDQAECGIKLTADIAPWLYKQETGVGGLSRGEVGTLFNCVYFVYS